MEYSINKLARMSGVTSRTLRYYDQISLLKPKRVNSSGYRIYGTEQVDALQLILFLRRLDMPLEDIQKIVKGGDRLSALQVHLDMLEKRQLELSLLIKNVKKTILKEEGTIEMTDEEKFSGLKAEIIKNNEERYGKEAREKYGSAVDASNAKFSSLTRGQLDEMNKTAEEISRKLNEAVSAGKLPDGEEGKEIAALHKKWLFFTWTAYSVQAHRGLAMLYVTDARFTQYYDAKREGCAQFLSDAILTHVK